MLYRLYAGIPRGFSLIWPIRGYAAGQRMVFVLAVLYKQGI